MMKLRRPCYIDGEEPLTAEEAETILRSRGYDPDAVGKRMDTVARQALKITQLEEENEQQAQTIVDCQKKIAQLSCQLEDALLAGEKE